MNSAALMTQTEYASHRGVRKSAVSNWKSQGLLVFSDDGTGKLLVDVQRTDAKLNANIDPTRGRPTAAQMSAAPAAAETVAIPKSQEGQLGEVRTDLLREQRIGHKIRNARDAGELVPLAEYEARVAELGRLSRERMHTMIRAHAERLAAEHDPRVITALLAAEVDRSFAELADQAEAGAFAAAEDDLPEPAEVEPA